MQRLATNGVESSTRFLTEEMVHSVECGFTSTIGFIADQWVVYGG